MRSVTYTGRYTPELATCRVMYKESHVFSDDSIMRDYNQRELISLQQSVCQDTSMCMFSRTKKPHCAKLPGLSYLTVHDSPGLDTSLCMTQRARMRHCAKLPGLSYLTVHDSRGKDTSLCMTTRVRILHCAWLPGQGYLTVHDSPPVHETVHVISYHSRAPG